MRTLKDLNLFIWKQNVGRPDNSIAVAATIEEARQSCIDAGAFPESVSDRADVIIRLDECGRSVAFAYSLTMDV